MLDLRRLGSCARSMPAARSTAPRRARLHAQRDLPAARRARARGGHRAARARRARLRLTDAGRRAGAARRHAARRRRGGRGRAGRARGGAPGRRRARRPRSSRRSCGSWRPRSPALAATHPDIRVEAIEAEVEDAVPALRLQQLDAVVGDEYEGQPRPVHGDLVRTRLLREQVRVVLPSAHPLARRRRVPFARLADAAVGRLPAGHRAPRDACSARAAGSAASSPTSATPPTTS